MHILSKLYANIITGVNFSMEGKNYYGNTFNLPDGANLNINLPAGIVSTMPAAAAAPATAGRVETFGIVVPVERHSWAYYTQDANLYQEYLDRGFCGMRSDFRDRFTHTCDGPLLAQPMTIYFPWWTWLLFGLGFIIMLAILGPSSPEPSKAKTTSREDQVERGEYVAVDPSDVELTPPGSPETGDEK